MKPQQQGEGGSSSGSKPSTPRGQERGGGGGGGVNIKIIETQTVHTDVTHFKSVVQGLTGKDSAAAGKPPESSAGPRNVQQKKGEGGSREEGKGEFDDILEIKLPSLEELKEFWDD